MPLQPEYYIYYIFLLPLFYSDCKACFYGKQGAHSGCNQGQGPTAIIHDSNENFELAIVFVVPCFVVWF